MSERHEAGIGIGIGIGRAHTYSDASGGRPTMTDTATATAQGTFTVKMTPHGEPDLAEGVSLGRIALDKRYVGDLVATGAGTMLTAMTPVQGSAGYVAIERVTGTLAGRQGSFIFQHAGTMGGGTQTLSIAVVPDSGTGGLTGLKGVFTLEVVDTVHRYTFSYTLPAHRGAA